MNQFREILHQYWGYDSFRSLQEDIIQSVYEGNDSLGLMPTGGGKSLTFQVPTLLMEGVCIVVTPLIALMKDQVDRLRSLGIKAACVHSGMGSREIITALENCVFGDYKFLYIAPERINSEVFLSRFVHMNVCLIAVDESHCISQWGYDFRPSYLHIADLRNYFPDVPVLALTATATPEVIEDIQDKLQFKQRNVFKKSFRRENISYVVRQTADKVSEIIHILEHVPGSAIVYVRSRNRTEELSLKLQEAGISADFFHAGINPNDKARKQDNWKEDRCRVIVATNAFGMGIDKPDVRSVVHYELPSSLEEYFQEAGRAGRDGEKAYAVALTSSADRTTLKRRIKDTFPEKEFVKDVYEKLAYYYEIGMNMGMNTGHLFNLGEFCRIFHYNMSHVHSALKILTLSGYIEFIEETERHSRLLFLTTREELYSRFQKETDDLINALMRTYTGLFSEYRYIDEELIGQKVGLSSKQVYDLLYFLSTQKIVDYIPVQRLPIIYYSLPREELRYMDLPANVYEKRKERLAHQIEKVLHYGGNQLQCRSQLLLNYFGEKTSDNCGCCDICLDRKFKENQEENYRIVGKEVLCLLENQDLSVKDLLKQVDYPEKQVIDILRFLLDMNQIEVQDDLIVHKI